MSALKQIQLLFDKDQILSVHQKQDLMNNLTELFIKPKFTEDVCKICRCVILDIVARAAESVKKDNRENFYIALSKGITVCPDLRSYAVDYLQKNSKSLPLTETKQYSSKAVVEIAKATWRLVKEIGDSLKSCIQVDNVLSFLSQYKDNLEASWFCGNAVAQMLCMSSSQREEFLSNFFPDKSVFADYQIRYGSMSRDTNTEESGKQLAGLSSRIQEVLASFTDTDFHHSIVMVAGIMLPKAVVVEDLITTCSLIPVESTVSHLRSLALAVASGNPVLLQGPVGCGKTSLVEHLAQVTGRQKSPALMKIQLGDQTDSKALLGTYRCTDIPGEFLWQPGILTRAVTEGHWVVLEDIDSAPMDVVSVLLPLLERNALSLPGHGDNIHTSPNFRLFATQRLLGSHSGWHRQHNNSSVLLEKMWTKISVEPLSRVELEQVITTQYAELKPVVDRLLDIYFMLSAGKHDTEGNQEESVGKFLSHDGRLISTRDLMTWCRRIAVDFDLSSTATANLVLQEGLDCFVSCLSSSQKRLLVAEAIGAKLNITKVKAEYYCSKYKPEVKITQNKYNVGRAVLQKSDDYVLSRSHSTFSFTRQSSSLLEKVAVSVMSSEPVLLVGETGTGKTSSVQYLAQQLGHTLKVVNMNQQSDSSDLLGGFKPVDIKHVVKPFHEDFEILFCETFSRKENVKFITHLQDCFIKKKWNMLLTLMEHTMKPAFQRIEAGKMSSDRSEKWKNIKHRLQQLKVQVQQTENVLAFAFIEGTLVKALRNGDWVLLDEINLAAAETLECLSGLLESQAGSLVLTERGDMEPVVRHKNFQLFACMNPATDVGKKDLPIGIRNRFTEFYVDELEDIQDLKILVSDYLRGLAPTSGQIEGIVKFYLTVREEAVKKLTDGTGHRPHFSLRTLCRALRYASSNPCGQKARSLYEGFCLSFLTQLDRSSHPIVDSLICQHVLGKSNIKSILKQQIPMPSQGQYLNFEGYWISTGKKKAQVPDHYILTPSVRQNLKDLCRVISGGQHPVLLQGETSVGKTSLVTWLAKSSGNHCVRVNNHEHTDLQEYVGCYSADETGKLVFKEGVLVEAMRKGHWIILDELNLAPTDVLEALNRLLDDNRELFIPETQETIKAHPKFMLFATQNPPGHYGGRKMLSRAFRNRFIELHFDVIPSGELETILHERCSIPMSYSKKLVAVMLELQTRRRGSGVFAGKQGFMTLRDLFRWAERYKCKTAGKSKFYDWEQHMSDHGYMVLAGRVRKPEEELVVCEVIQKHFKRKVDPDRLFTLSPNTSTTTADLLKAVINESSSDFEHVVWTYGMRRLAVLIGQCILFKEPVLLVGETGCGKTTMCQVLSAIKNIKLYSINCHLHTESSDFLGGLRPCRSHDQEGPQRLFEWVDGPLVTAMKEGTMFLIDEISLADDSVLERLNSVLEPEQMILLAEKGGEDGSLNEVEQVNAKEGFQVFSTMNPGGDFGKKELSPALRNRFTEIWCPQTNKRQDFVNIIEHNIKSGIHLCNMEDGTSGIGKAIIDFIEWFSNNDYGKRCTVSIRDILSWVNFINVTSTTLHDDEDDNTLKYNKLEAPLAFIHGACLVFLDGLGSGTTSRGSDSEIEQTRLISLQFLLKQVSQMTHQSYDLKSLGLVDKYGGVSKDTVTIMEDEFCIWPFSVEKGQNQDAHMDNYALQAPTTCVNAQRILRGLQLPRPLLLEGSPGIGKTSLVAAIAKAAGRHLVRINLSEQTDVTDLFGADLPVEGAEGGVFAWRDGPLLQALKAGHWIVLDELNLASQSVLEGLNACLDHRAEVYIPELSKTFHIQHEKTRLFACQNPLNQGGGRKGLPRSFLNRFTQVYVEPLTSEDLHFIASIMFPVIPQYILENMVTFNIEMNKETVIERKWGHKGSPWEFNLRDLFRWCQLLISQQRLDDLNPGEYVSLLYKDRMRTVKDKQMVMELYQRIFSDKFPAYEPSKKFCITSSQIQCGHSFLPRIQHNQPINSGSSIHLLHHCLEPLESVMKCAEMNWLSIIIGPQSCGKTCLVQLLATLCGQDLQVLAMNSDMDTTELLGGFEQSDPARHIEELGSDIQTLLTRIEEFLLCKGDLHQVIGLHKSWKTYTEASKHVEKMSSVEELQQMKKQVDCLMKVLTDCSRVVKKYTELNTVVSDWFVLIEKLRKLQVKLAESKAGSGGGTFEWMDSILVTALQSGQWLLIDNVNFCSPSVLDRLNALLEPNGELTINERGVIDGEIPSIKPHPNFRLFLAMDPKFGDISRAMRNRGVEIYIPGEDEGSPYSNKDVKLLLQTLGLVWNKACDWLISFNDLLRSELSRGEQPTILDLLCVAAVTKQQIDRGIPLDKALKLATSDIYVKSVKYFTTKQIAKSIWNSKCEELVEKDLMSETMIYTSPTVTDCMTDVKLANIMQDGSSVMCYTKQLMNNIDRKCEFDVTFERTLAELKYAFQILMNGMPLSYWKLYIKWLDNFVQKLRTEMKSIEDQVLSKNLLTSVKELSDNVSSTMTLMDKGGFTKSLKNYVKNLTEIYPESSFLLEIPFDLRWNVQMIDRVIKLCDLDENKLAELHAIVNRFHLQQSVVHTICADNIRLEAIEENLQGIVKKSKIENEMILEDVYRLLTRKDDFLQMMSDLDINTFTEVAQVLGAFKWRSLLLVVLEKCFCNEADIHTLTLYWNWFYDKFICTIVNRMPAELSSIVQHIHSKLGQNNQLGKRYMKFWNTAGHPQAYKTKMESQFDLCLTDLAKQIDVHCPFVKLLAWPKIQLHITDSRTVTDLLLFCFKLTSSGLIEENKDVLCSKILEIRQLMCKSGINSDSVNKHLNEYIREETPMDIGQSEQSILQTSNYLPNESVSLWPLYESVIATVGRSLIHHMSDITSSYMSTYTDYCLHFTCMSPLQINMWQQAIETPGNFNEVYPLLKMKLYKQLWNLTPAQCVNRYLNLNTEIDGGDLSLGPGFLFTPTFSYLASHYLSNSENSQDGRKTYENRLQPLQVPLGNFSCEIEKLNLMSKQLWCNCSLLAETQYDPRTSERRNIAFEFKHLMKSITASLSEENQSVMGQILPVVELMSNGQTDQIQNSEFVEKFCFVLKSIFSEHNAVENCVKSVLDIVTSSETSTLQSIGTAWVYLGLVSIELLTPYLSVDPVEKVAIKIEILTNELNEIEYELAARSTHHFIQTGDSLDSLPDSLMHPHVVHLKEKQCILQQKIQALQHQQAYRPKPSQFRSVVSLITNFKTSIGSVNHVTNLLKKLMQTTVAKTTKTLNEEEAWQKSVTSFIQNMDENFPHYRDITIPFLVALYQIKHGMRLVATDTKQSNYHKDLTGRLHTQNEDLLSTVMLQLSEVPSVSLNSPDFLYLAQNINSTDTQKVIGSLVPDSTTANSLLSSLRSSGLDLVNSDSFIRKELTPRLIFTLSKLLDQFVETWQQQEERRRQKEEEDDCLYRYKAQLHGDERMEAEKEEDEFKQNFPSFEQDYMDVSGRPTLEGPEPVKVDSSSTSQDSISEEEMNTICRIHHAIFTLLTNADWLKQTCNIEVKVQDIIRPVLSNYMVMTSLLKPTYQYLNEKIDKPMFGGHLIVASVVQEQISQQGSSITEDYDIYYDSNVSEAVKCLPVIDKLVHKVQELQIEWPGHPTLKQLVMIGDRIKSFAVTSPVIKFLTGIELLLEKAQDWESNAAKHVSMMTELSEITAVIIEWRKLELSCWSKCLDTVCRKHSRKASRWWFHLYQLIQSYLMPSQVGEGDNTPMTDKDILKSLLEFMEKSTLGECKTRLEMVKSFHCQLVNMDLSDKQKYLVNLLWNIYQFYNQFSAMIDEEIQRLRAPVEKELKGFVKIARWTDMNYWALKTTTEKTHRTLHKHVKTFQDILNQPVRAVYQEKTTSISSEQNISKWREEFVNLNIITKKPIIIQQVDSPDVDLPLLSRAHTLCGKVYKHWRGLTEKMQYRSIISELDEFIGDMIEEVHELQAKEVNQLLEKDKQKSEAKHICHLRRRALADLFKHLTACGLSYRKGLTMSSREDKDTLPLTVDPVDFNVLMESCTYSKYSEMVCSTWTGCQQYYYRCISRKAKLASALMTPSQELGLGNMDRCRGFTEHLMSLVVQQYKDLSSIGQHYKSISMSLEALTSVIKDGDSTIQPNQIDSNKWHVDFKELLTSIAEGMIQFEALLQSCPKSIGETTHHPSPVGEENLSKMALVKHGDTTWTNCMTCVQTIRQRTVELHRKLVGENKTVIWTMISMRTLSEAAQSLESIVPDMQGIINLFKSPSDNSLCEFTSSLSYLSERINKFVAEFKSWTCLEEQKMTHYKSESGEINEEVKQFASNAEELVSSILMVIQNIRKNHESEKPVTDAENGENEAMKFEDGLFVKQVIEKVKEDVTHVLNTKITNSIQHLMDQLISHWNSSDPDTLKSSVPCVKLVSHCLPLLQQYCDVIEYYLLQSLAANRTTAKLLSVLLGIFTELASKGFCTPAEFSDEVAGEGATDFEDIENAGMGEGEGVKDVSDQIENEDQLDEARKPGDKPEEKSDQPDIPSEDNAIEMSDDMDGKLHDVDPQEEGEEDEEGEEQEEIDKQMGEVDDQGEDKLDEQMWGSDEEEPEEQENQKEEEGPGSGQESKSELVAKDDNEGAEEDDQNKESSKENKDNPDEENKQPNELDQMDTSEYDEDKVDPYQNEKEPEKPPNGMDLPDDLQLDDDIDKEEEGPEGQEESQKEEPSDDMDTENIPDEENRENTDDKNDEEMSPEEKEEQSDGLEKENTEDENDERQEEEGKDEPGFSAQEPSEENPEDQIKEEDKEQPQGAEVKGQTIHDSQNVEQSDTAHDQAGESENNQEEAEGTGTAQSELEEGHQGQSSSKVTQGSNSQQQKQLKRKPGKSDVDRSLGSVEDKYKKLKTTDTPATESQEDESTSKEADLYEHVKDATSKYDTQTVDTATTEQQLEQPLASQEGEECEQDDDVDMADDDTDQKTEDIEMQQSLKLKSRKKEMQGNGDVKELDDVTMEKVNIPGDVIDTLTVGRGPVSTIHTKMEYLHTDVKEEVNVEKLREELESQLTSWSHTNSDNALPEEAAAEAWNQYEVLTSNLSQELCEQLRLILEPSQATKLKGDYRTGKRLNMRKVIPYIASQFRKDKIWLRRTKPSKRQYQIMLAIDDSSSMVDNHSKQLAFESLAMISNALTLLEAGELGICSFGENVRLVHDFNEQFSNHSGAKLLQHFTFEQKKTKIAQLLKQITVHMMDARSRQRGMMGNPDTAQLLLIVSDGRGLFMEGMETVKSAVRQARESNIFLVFVVIDNPQAKDSILDIRVPVFKGANSMPEIKSYMDNFPFPFYIILRDINSLPQVLCDALRQWFELVTSTDS
ncbi:midasin-like isoform X3 [Mytilus galloprovincialis]|uniref:midasin-like isoform X3 n=1 Tax=Mytilus galloprovincialis TaxID=29158 RepID=UPI003F7BDF74